MKISFFVPGHPRPRRAPYFGKGKAFHPKGGDAETWKDRIHAAALIARQEQGVIEGPVVVSVEFVFPAPKRVKHAVDHEPGVHIVIESQDWGHAMTSTPDLDNLEKIVMDAIKDVVIGDDKLVWDKHSRKIYGRKGG